MGALAGSFAGPGERRHRERRGSTDERDDLVRAGIGLHRDVLPVVGDPYVSGWIDGEAGVAGESVEGVAGVIGRDRLAGLQAARAGLRLRPAEVGNVGRYQRGRVPRAGVARFLAVPDLYL